MSIRNSAVVSIYCIDSELFIGETLLEGFGAENDELGGSHARETN